MGYKYKNWNVLLLIVGALPPHPRFFFLFWGRCPQTPLPHSICAILRRHCPSPPCVWLTALQLRPPCWMGALHRSPLALVR